MSIPYNNMCINALLIHAKSLMPFLFCRSPRPPRNLPTTTFYADIVRAVPLALPAPPSQQLNMTSELVKIVIEVKKEEKADIQTDTPKKVKNARLEHEETLMR